jgi:hypothetical protein
MTSGPHCPFQRQDAIKSILDICERTFQHPRPDGSLPRQFHEKTHACLRGEFQVHALSQPFLRHGLFAGPARYPALVRFSNSFFEDDRCPDGRGMAIKLDNVIGDVCDGAPPGQHDMLLVDQASAPFRNAEEAACFFKLLDGVHPLTTARLTVPKYVIPSFNPWRMRLHYLTLLRDTAWRKLIGKDLANLDYYSSTPYQLGEGATKYFCRPDGRSRGRAKTKGRNFRDRLQRSLDLGAFGFDFYLQPRLKETDGIDDAVKAWTSPIFRAGHLEIYPQNVSETVALGDRLAFSPWNCLRAHTPLGSLNEVRRLAYRASAEKRIASPVFPKE